MGQVHDEGSVRPFHNIKEPIRSQESPVDLQAKGPPEPLAASTTTLSGLDTMISVLSAFK